AAARAALTLLEGLIGTHGTAANLGEFKEAVGLCAGGHDHMAIIGIATPNGGCVTHWEVCNKKMPYTSSVKTARDMMARLVDEYGQRALQAERQEGVDWKALSHAVRVGEEALELLTTG